VCCARGPGARWLKRFTLGRFISHERGEVGGDAGAARRARDSQWPRGRVGGVSVCATVRGEGTRRCDDGGRCERSAVGATTAGGASEGGVRNGLQCEGGVRNGLQCEGGVRCNGPISRPHCSPWRHRGPLQLRPLRCRGLGGLCEGSGRPNISPGAAASARFPRRSQRGRAVRGECDRVGGARGA
jgi:hypothetical protein